MGILIANSRTIIGERSKLQPTKGAALHMSFLGSVIAVLRSICALLGLPGGIFLRAG
jgi:hypothetical protein